MKVIPYHFPRNNTFNRLALLKIVRSQTLPSASPAQSVMLCFRQYLQAITRIKFQKLYTGILAWAKLSLGVQSSLVNSRQLKQICYSEGILFFFTFIVFRDLKQQMRSCFSTVSLVLMSMSPKDLITYSRVHSVFIPKQVSLFHATVHSALLNNIWEDFYLSMANIQSQSSEQQ